MTTFVADEVTLSNFSSDIGGLWCRPVDVLDEPPDSLVFLRDYVNPKVPCIIRNVIPSPAASSDGNHILGNHNKDSTLKLTLDNIIDCVGDNIKITVDVTPDGHGDYVRTVACDESSDGSDEENVNATIHKKMFVKPHEQEMTLNEFRSLLRAQQTFSGCQDDGAAETSGSQRREFDSNGLTILHMVKSLKHESKEMIMQQNIIHRTTCCPPVVYYSRQNDCLRTEMSPLFSTGLFPTTFAFAEEAFGTGPPDAINLWIGNEQSVSSTHKDHYENLFYVCSGQKEFILNPPADILFLHEGEFDSGSFCPCYKDEREELTEATWTVIPDNDTKTEHNSRSKEVNTLKAKWIEPDVKKYLNGGYSNGEFPLICKSHPIKVLVSQGEMLYIPSLWLHRVTQTTETVGVNFWYDMKFDSPHWCYFNFLQQLKEQVLTD